MLIPWTLEGVSAVVLNDPATDELTFGDTFGRRLTACTENRAQ